MDKKNIINVVTNLLAMALALLINFLITPIVTEKLGIEVYGYVSVISNLTSFMVVITYTLNSMVGRFYTVAYNTDKDKSNRYISTALFTCLFIGILIIPVSILATANLEKLIVIKEPLVADVKLAFFLSCISLVLSSITSVFYTGAYSKNRLEIMNFINISANVVRLVLIITLFKVFSAHIWFINISSVIQITLCAILGYVSFKKLVPDVKFSYRLFSISCSRELLSAGLFNAVIMLGTNLMTSIDTIVGNRFLSDDALVGRYAVILLFSNTMRSLASALSSAFSPSTIKIYADGDKESLVAHSNKVVSFCGLALGWPISIIASVGTAFLSIWLGKDFSEFKYLIVFMMLPLVANLAVFQLGVVNQAINKLKVPAAAAIVSGFLNLGLAVLLVRYFNVWGIALASVISFSLLNIIFTPIYTAFATGQRINAYYRGLVLPLIVSTATCAAGILLQIVFAVDSFYTFILICSALSIIYALLTLAVIGSEKRQVFFQQLKKIYCRPSQ